MFHKMTNQDWKDFIQAESELEAVSIMAEVDNDPLLKEVKAPEGMREKLFERVFKREGGVNE